MRHATISLPYGPAGQTRRTTKDPGMIHAVTGPGGQRQANDREVAFATAVW